MADMTIEEWMEMTRRHWKPERGEKKNGRTEVTIRRFNIQHIASDFRIIDEPDGKYVLYTDYAELEATIKRVKAEVRNIDETFSHPYTTSREAYQNIRSIVECLHKALGEVEAIDKETAWVKTEKFVQYWKERRNE